MNWLDVPFENNWVFGDAFPVSLFLESSDGKRYQQPLGLRRYSS